MRQNWQSWPNKGQRVSLLLMHLQVSTVTALKILSVSFMGETNSLFPKRMDSFTLQGVHYPGCNHVEYSTAIILQPCS